MTCDDVVVPASHVLRGDGMADTILAWYRTNLAARAVGVAQASMEHARRYCEERIQFGQPIGTFESLIRLRDRNETAAASARLATPRRTSAC